MSKVIKIKGSDYRVAYTCGYGANPCSSCAFNSSECPETGDDGLEYNPDEATLLCKVYDDNNAYFVAEPNNSLVEPSEPLVEVFKQAAGITREKTFAEADVRAAFKDWSGDEDATDRFMEHMKKFSDPEYKEFLRMKKKFGE